MLHQHCSGNCDNHQGLCRERARQARANKLAHALEALESGNKENDPRTEERALYCMLQPEEEALVDRLLAQVMPPAFSALGWQVLTAQTLQLQQQQQPQMQSNCGTSCYDPRHCFWHGLLSFDTLLLGT